MLIQLVEQPAAAAAAAKSLQSCLTLRPRRWQPTRLRRPWDSPGKNTSGLPFPSPMHESEVAEIKQENFNI